MPSHLQPFEQFFFFSPRHIHFAAVVQHQYPAFSANVFDHVAQVHQMRFVHFAEIAAGHRLLRGADRLSPVGSAGARLVYQVGDAQLTVREMAERSGLEERTIRYRLAAGLRPVDAMQAADQRQRQILVGEQKRSISEMATSAGVDRGTIRARLKAGWTPSQAAGWAPKLRTRIRRGRPIVLEGVELTMSEAAARLGLALDTLSTRLRRGWSVEQACGLEPRPPKPLPPRRRGRLIVIDGEELSISEAAARSGLEAKLVWRRLARGWSVEQACGLEPAPSKHGGPRPGPKGSNSNGRRNIATIAS